MATLYLDAVDFSCIPAKRFAVPVVDVDPQGYDGGLIWNSTEQVLKHYDGSDWAVVGSEGAGGPQYALLSDVDDRFAKVALWVGDPTPLHVNSTLSEWLSDLADEVHHLSARPAFSLDGILHVDLYNGFARAFSNTPELEIGGEKWVEFELATTPAPGGTIPPGANAIASSAGTLVRAGGTQGPVVGETGGAVSQMALANYISQNRICRVLYDLSNPVRPTLTILETLDAIPTGTSALHLGALYDVSAPANTPAGKVLGTVADGSWGPVDPPEGGGDLTQAQADARYVNLDGDRMTGTLEVETLSGVPAVLQAVSGSMSSTTSSVTALPITLPGSILAGDMIVLVSINASQVASEHMESSLPSGFARFPNYSMTGPQIGTVNSSLAGCTLYYKMATGSEGGTVVTVNYVDQTGRRLFAVVVRGAADPAVQTPVIGKSATEHNISAGAATLTGSGLMLAITAGIHTSVSTAPTTTWGEPVVQGDSLTATGEFGSIYAGRVDAGPNPAVAFAYATTPYAFCSGFLFLPDATSGAKLNFVTGVSMGSNTLDGLPAPATPTAAATKGYVDGRTPPLIVLGPTDPVPGETAVGTVIVRKDV